MTTQKMTVLMFEVILNMLKGISKRLLIAMVISVAFLSSISIHANEKMLPADFPEASDQALQTLLNKNVANRSLGRLITSEKLSITLVDITDINNPKLAHVNGQNTLYAASLPKLGILLATFEEIHQGNLPLSRELYNSLENMIRNSSNKDATKLYELVGAERIADILRSDRYQFYNKDTGGGLWVGKPYAKNGVWKRDPLKNVSHGASGLQVARFYYLLERNELTDPSFCPIMKDILSDSNINHKFVKGLRTRQPTAEIYRKSGTWRDYHSDSALIERADGVTYIAVALSQSANGSKLLENIIVDLDKIMDTFHSS